MAEEETVDPVALVDHEGNFSEGFLESLPEEIRDEPSLKQIANLPDAMKQLVNAQRMVGKDKVVLPGDGASEDDWGEFFNQVGRPKTAGDYPYERAEGVPENLRTDDRLKDIRESAHKMNLTVTQFNQMMAQDDARIIDEESVRESGAEIEADESEKYLKEKWGMAYEERVHIVNRLINETTTEGDERDNVIKVLGRNKVFVEWAAGIGKTLVEHDALIAELTQKAPKEAQAELDEFKASEDYQKYLRGEFATDNPSKHNMILKKETELMDIIHPTKG